MFEWQLREEICEVGRRVWQRQLVAANEGNISARISPQALLVTPTMVSKGFMQTHDLIKIDYEGNILEGKGRPSSEIKLHIAIYEERPDVNAVAHTHPPHATAFAITGTHPPRCVLPEVEVLIGQIPLAEYGRPGTAELAENVKSYLKGSQAVLMSNHGLVCLGASLEEAYFRTEVVEQYCRILILARQLGEVKKLSQKEMQYLSQVRQQLGLTPEAPSCYQCGFCEREEKAGLVSASVIENIVEEVISRLGLEKS